jgi:hypothetical protein
MFEEKKFGRTYLKYISDDDYEYDDDDDEDK